MLGSNALGVSLFFIYVQIHSCFNISTLNDQKKKKKKRPEPVRRDKNISICLSQKEPAESNSLLHQHEIVLLW